ncbi:hypothetical protein C8R48DRAFT_685705 [Suillus tomentosus]|nr:hypothetical protein C8R48DRAFT_685705 [Suillus tomentosus]
MLHEPLLPESTTTHNGGSASVVERCRQLLAPVLLMSAKSQDSSTALDITACAAMLTDDRCREFLQQSRDMKLQIDALSALHPPKNPRVGAVDPHINKEDLKRGMEKHGESTRTTRVWLDSDTLSIGSRKDSEATLVDLPIDHKAFSPLQDSIHRSVKDVTLLVKQIMEHDEAPSSHDPNSTNVQASAPASVPHQMAPSSSLPVEDVAMAISLAHHSGPSPADPQNTATCSSANSYPSSSLKIPTLSMPGTWFGRQGLTRPGILTIDFAVGDRIIPAASSSSSSNVPFTVQLSCFRKDPHHELQEGDSLDITLDKIRSVGEDWPAKGTLVVQLNVESANGRSWLPYELEKGALNVTPSITQGNNTMRLIHLNDLSDFTFVLYTLSPELPKRAEPWRGRCWASKISQPDSEIPFDTTNIIQHYANVPVIVS